tara:strand:+ start:412 stop:1296 length:885 start_codon:yes stop_codon:yes gene_type:complete
MNSDNLPINIITHFHNEEYLLPFWIDWHKRLPIDSVTFIDYSSTDDSCKIVREQAPEHWNLIKSKNADFSAFSCDQEVMEIEKEIHGWKMALNTTEFLMMPPDVNSYLNTLINDAGTLFPEHWNTNLIYCPSVGVIGGENQNPKNTKEFLTGFNKGYISNPPIKDSLTDFEKSNTVSRSHRIMHRLPNAKYTIGRHSSEHVKHGYEITSNNMFVAWIGYYPWNQKTLDRKLQIKTQIPEKDIKRNYGLQHQWSTDKLNSIRKELESNCEDLTNPFNNSFSESYKNTYEHCLTLF